MQKRTFTISNLKVKKRDGLTAEDPQQGIIVDGYAAVFNKRTTIEDYYYEEIAPGAFANWLRSGFDIRCLFNHNWDYVLGRVSANTLKLEEDSHGLHFVVELPNTSYARDLAESMGRGDIGECSFLFYDTAREEDFTLDKPLIRITECELYEVSIVTLPQYEEAKASLRSKQRITAATKRKKILEKIGDYLNEDA